MEREYPADYRKMEGLLSNCEGQLVSVLSMCNGAQQP